MSNIIRIKRRLDNGTNVSGAPSQGSLLNAELAYNEVDGTLYYGKGEGQGGVAQEIVSIGGTGYIQRTVEFASSQLSGQMQSNFETLTGQIDSLSQAMETAVSDEAIARSTADSALSGAIDDLNVRVDNVLSNVDSVALNSLAEIVSAFQAADNDINGAISQLAGGSTTALATASAVLVQSIADEVNRATGIEGGLQTALDNEVATRISEITRVEGLVSAEVTDRGVAVAGVQTALDSEVTARGVAVAGVQTALDAEVTAREGAITSLETEIMSLSSDMISRDAAALVEAKGYTDNAISALVDGAPELLNTLKELASAIGDDENYFVHIASQIAALSAGSTSGLADEIARAQAAEGALGLRIDDVVADILTEKNRAEAAEGNLSDDINAEETRALAAEDGLSDDIAAEETRAKAAEQALAADITSLNTRVDNVLSNVDATALNSLAEIVSAFQAADNDINGAISQLAGAATTSLASVSATLNQSILDEVARAQAAEGALDDRVDVVVDDLTAEVTRATAAEGALDTRVDDIEANYLDKRVGGTVDANLAVTGTLEVGSGTTTLFVEAGKVGVNTETPSEALDVVGNIKASGNFIGSGTSTISGFIMDGGLF